MQQGSRRIRRGPDYAGPVSYGGVVSVGCVVSVIPDASSCPERQHALASVSLHVAFSLPSTLFPLLSFLNPR